MDLVVRTPHGAADVTMAAFDPGATLADLIRLVTGQAVPSVAELDGRAIDTATRLADAELALGSVVDTTPPDPPGPAPAVGLLQLAGPGAGAIRPLPPGRYRLGPGRRLRGAELATAPVEVTVLELTIGDDGTVEARPGYAEPVSINGSRISEPTAWHGGMLEVGNRVFAVDAPWPPPAERRLEAPDAGGTIAFVRPPPDRDDRPRYVVVDAVRDARSARGSLWKRRAGDLTAFTVPFGFAGDPLGPITLDLAAERGVVLVGDDQFTAGLARSILLEATTLHGPSDLGLAIAVDPGRLAQWDWAKWLPHLRDGGAPRYLTDDSQLREWVTRINSQALDRAGAESDLTLLVTDDPGLWTDRSSPLSALASSPPAGLRLLVLTAPGAVVPAICSARVSSADDGRARLNVPDRQIDVTGILPALTEIATAADVARDLAPLDDGERPPGEPAPPVEAGPVTLSALLAPHATAVDGIIDRWQRCTLPLPELLTVPLGTSAGATVATELGPRRDLVVTGQRAEVAADVVVGVVAALAAQLPPDRLSIVLVTTHGGSALDRIDGVPHVAGRFAEPGAAAAMRLIVRLAMVAGRLDPAEHRVVAVVDDAGRTAASSPGLTEGLVELAAALPALHLVMTADRSGQIDLGPFAAQVSVEEWAGGHRGSLRVDGDRLHRPFLAYAGSAARPGPAGLVLRPAVFGRPLTPLERRLDLLAQRDASRDRDELEAFTGALTAAATHLGRAPAESLVPRPLPPLHRSETLLAERLGDAVPIGLVDRPEEPATAPLWWQPGARGSMLFLGSPRSGVDAALTTMILGAGSRFSADDLHIYVIDPLARRRSAAALLPHTGMVTSPDRPAEAVALLSWLRSQIERRRRTTRAAVDRDPALLVLVHDIGQLRRESAEPDEVIAHLEAIATAGDVNVNLVATAWRAEAAGSLLDVVAELFVGALVEPSDYDLLGVIDPPAVEAQLGRCWSTARARMVQLALPPASLAAEVAALRAEPATVRPPVRPAADRGPA